MKRKQPIDTGLWNLDSYDFVFVRLMYGFCLEQLEIKDKKCCKEDYCYCDNEDSGGDLRYQSLEEFLSTPCKTAIVTFLCIKKYALSVLSNVPKDIILMISKKVWDDRKNFLPFKLEKHSRFMYGRRDTDTYVGVTYDILQSVFNHPTFVYSGEFCMSTAEPQQSVVRSYKKFFPKYVPSKIYILDGDIYTSHYVAGEIMYGFFFNVNSDEYIDGNIRVNDIDFRISQVGHNLESKYDKFIGICLDSVDGVDSPVVSMENANVFHNKFSFANIADKYGHIDDMKDFIKKEIIDLYIDMQADGDGDGSVIDVDIHDYPIIGFIPQMCYCCT